MVGLIYIGNETYRNLWFTLQTGEAVVTTDLIGQAMLSEFPDAFEEFDCPEMVLKNGTIEKNKPYPYYNQFELNEVDDRPTLYDRLRKALIYPTDFDLTKSYVIAEKLEV